MKKQKIKNHFEMNVKIFRAENFFTFFHTYVVEKVLFLDQVFEMEILMDLHALKPYASQKSHF